MISLAVDSVMIIFGISCEAELWSMCLIELRTLVFYKIYYYKTAPVTFDSVLDI